MSLSLFIASLLVTTFIEAVLARSFGLKGKRTWLIILLINAITNPALNYLVWVDLNFLSPGLPQGSTLMAEAVVVLVEWMLLVYSFGQSKWRMLALSLVMNAVSFVLGFVFSMTFGLLLAPLAWLGL